LVTPSAVIVGSQGSEWNKPDADDAVLALDPKTGAQLWRVPADSDVNGIGLYGSTVIFGTDNGTLVALDAQNGNTRWSTPTGCPLRHPPALVGGQLHLLRESGLASVSAETGKGPQELPPCRRSDRGGLSVADDVIYASANNRPLAAYRDGRELWRVASPSPTLTSFVAWTPPYVGAELLLQSVQRWTFDGTQGVATEPALLAVWRDNGQVAWAARVNAPDIVDPTGNLPGDPHFKMPPWVAGDRAFVASNAGPVLEAFNLADGSRAGTIKLPDCRTRQFGGIVGTPDMGYFARHDGVVYGFSPSRMAIEWSLSVGLHAAAGGRSTHFVAPAGCSPEPADGTALFAPPALGADGTLYVGSGDGWLYAITDASTAASPR
jgi:outer membrane protein assembly factor BamB